jgi:dihydropteroate synthase
MELDIGGRRFDVTHRALVMGILNRTTDSFYDGGAYFRLDDFLHRAECLVADGADLLDVGARAAGVGTRDVSETEECDLVVSSVVELRRRFDVPVSVDTWRAGVAAAAFEAGAAVGNDVSGFSDPAYLTAAARAGAAVVATHMRLQPQVPDPEPVYDEPVADVAAALRRLAARAEEAGIPRERIMVDPGLDLGKTWQQSVLLLARSDLFAGLGYPLLLAPSNKIFLGRLLGLERHERGPATVAACALGALRGARVLRVHDAGPARQAVELAAAVLRNDGGGPW